MSELALQLIRENIKKHQRGEDATYLDLGNCGLTHLPPELGECVWVETLILSNVWEEYDLEKKQWNLKKSQNEGEPNRIASIKGVEKLRKLKTLVVAKHNSDLGKNWELNDLSPLAGLMNLQHINCNSTQIRDLSPLAGLMNLQHINCNSTQIRDLSPLAGLMNLQHINCNSTQISDLSPLAGLVNLQHINCNSTQISDLKPLENLSQLKVLICSETLITDFNPLTKISSLESLWLSNIIFSENINFKKINTCFFKRLICLKTLWVSTFDLGDLSFLSELSQLEDLNIATSTATNFEVIGGLKKLKRLNCSTTTISNIEFIRNLRFIEEVNCQNTQVSDLGPLTGLSNLQVLELSYTQISDLSPLLPLIKKGIPVKWARFTSGITVQDCPLTNPPREIVEQGNEAILSYFAEKERSGTEKSLEAKVVLIGEGQAGKTSLLTRLLRPGTALPNKEDRTKGLDIEIEKYAYEIPGGEQMRLNVFDFGGQDHYKPLHHFFYSKNTLYVMVSRNGDAATNDFDYWLDTAQLFGQNSPLLLVHNLFGDVRSSFNRAKYERFGEVIKDSLDVNLGDFSDRRWDEIKSRIEYFASRLPHVHEEIPKSWANVRRALLARREEEVIDLEDYLALCALPENGGMDEARALRCSAYLHDIGIILHYQQDSDLREYVIVKNEWATDAAYRVIDDAEIAKRQGLFYQKTDLPRIWCQSEYRKMRLQLLQLMKHFRLCYPLKADGEFIAPQLLPPNPPEGYSWQPEQDLTMYFEYDFMPLGLMSQLIVECHLLIAEERRLVWRDGAVLELTGGDARAEVLLQKRNGKQTIGIRAQGRKRRDLMTIVNGKIVELHKPFGSGLKVEKKIPCVCTRCEKVEDKWYFNLSELENRLKAGREKKDCEVSYESVSIDALLGNVFSKQRNFNSKLPEEDSDLDIPLRAFVSYSKADKAYLDEFKKHLKPLQRSGQLMHWDDSKIAPGEEWDDAIKAELARADIIFLLLSPDFLNTDYIWEVEIPQAMCRHKVGEATVIPIKIRNCGWEDMPYADLQALPRKSDLIGPNPVNDDLWKAVTDEIRQLLRSKKRE